MRLLNDMSRCMGELSDESATVSVPCNERIGCARWLAWQEPSNQVVVMQRRFKANNTATCNDKIKVGK